MPNSDLLQPEGVYLERMMAPDIDEVVAIETNLYEHPWTCGNFCDSLNSGYEAWTARDSARSLAGYFLVMLAVDEAHLLNVAVRRDLHGQGLGRMMLNKIVSLACGHRLESVFLEVRPSNRRALAAYQAFGFSQVALRKAYYPAAGAGREDAIIMRLQL